MSGFNVDAVEASWRGGDAESLCFQVLFDDLVHEIFGHLEAARYGDGWRWGLHRSPTLRQALTILPSGPV